MAIAVVPLNTGVPPWEVVLGPGSATTPRSHVILGTQYVPVSTHRFCMGVAGVHLVGLKGSNAEILGGLSLGLLDPFTPASWHSYSLWPLLLLTVYWLGH